MNEKPKDYILEKNVDGRDLFALLPEEELAQATEEQIHLLKKNIICVTDYRARKPSPFEIVFDATDGFIPVWAENQVLRWRFNDASLSFFQHPTEIAASIRNLFGEAVMAWGMAAPIRFDENSDNSDFEILVDHRPRCSPQGCTLARAFFPDAGRHQLIIYPSMFEQNRQEQIETMAHEIGHIFGLRHFFAPDQESQWASVIFGEHRPFSIMNYGNNSFLTDTDRNDLKTFYDAVWSGRLREINRTPIRQFRPFHTLIV